MAIVGQGACPRVRARFVASAASKWGLSAMEDGHPLPSNTRTARVIAMLRYFEKLGHFRASTDPLDYAAKEGYPWISAMRHANSSQCTNDLESFGLTSEEDQKALIDDIKVPWSGGLLGDESTTENNGSLKDWEGREVAIIPRCGDKGEGSCSQMSVLQLYERLKSIYCGSIGVEFLHIHNREKINWLRNQLETTHSFEYSKEQKKKLLEKVSQAVLFEQYAAAKFATVKRFGLDGCEGFILALDRLLKVGVLLGVRSAVMSMAHRGRINTLMNIMNKPKSQIFSEFMGHTGFGNEKWGNCGDVKYHMGAETLMTDKDTGTNVLYTLLPNPSHLEAADPVCLGTTKARQDLLRIEKAESEKEAQKRVLPIIVHGDASIGGQGVVYETVQMTSLRNYNVGGTIHIVINNQIGFTTNPGDGCSGNYCTDVAKCVEAPIFHVNGDDPEAIARVMEIAIEFRQKFQADVFIDIVGYRRSGHNELDMPKFTQPKMYQKIEKHPNIMELYARKLIAESVITQEEFDSLKARLMADYNKSFEQAKVYKPSPLLRPFNPQWKDQMLPTQYSHPRITGVPEAKIKEIGKVISTLPQDAEFHPTIKRVYKQRLEALHSGKGIDFGLAEALAFGTLMKDGVHVRLMGQDAERGTFSHRHAVIKDQKTGKEYMPLKSVAGSPVRGTPPGENSLGTNALGVSGSIHVGNSHLSEFGCLGFEYGYSLESPNILPLWEAQFGDFANGAQTILDQFFVSGEAKWAHPSGLTLLLPHGYDGQGSEHSSARLERFLQMCDDREDVIDPNAWSARHNAVQQHNIQVCNPSTPANYFHLLRRQVHRGFRKPLVVFSPKRLLRMREANSLLNEFTEGTKFQRYISDPMFSRRSAGDEAVMDIENTPGASVKAAGAKPALASRNHVRRLVLCSGQVYYDLAKARGTNDSVMIGRVEQISPFPFELIAKEISTLPYLESIVWCQEEPMNMGAWTYVRPRLDTLLRNVGYYNGIRHVQYAGRDASAAPATGDPKIHQKELQTLLDDAFNLAKKSNSYQEKYC